MGGGTPLPSGTVTFLFTDIERSTQTVETMGDAAYADALEEHRQLLRDAFAQHAGHEVGTEGDAFFVAFARAQDAVGAASDGQRALSSHALRVRMGIHTGEAIVRGNDYVGHDVHKAKRVCDAGHGGQILLSQTTADLVASHAHVVDLGPHRLKDLGEPQPIFQLRADGLRQKFPRLRSLDSLDNNLPIQLTSFVGRERELCEARELLANTRLLTITGAGGSGKTRLALQLLGEILPDTAGGVWFADLAPLTDASLVPSAVVEAVLPRGRVDDATGDGHSSPLERLVEHLGGRPTVLLLDNCEHVLGSSAELTGSLLGSCRELKMVVTTREPLGVPGETSWRLPSLEMPDADPVTVDDLLAGEASRLFCERAAQADAHFRPQEHDVGAIGDICRRLDGIPLAIELAASRIRLLAASEIDRRLDDRFRLLTGGSRTSLPRQQTLRATVDWSYDLLDGAQQTMLDRLSVFTGGFTLEGAEAVCADETIAADDVLDLLAALVDRSLVVRYEHGGAPRFRLLDTIRHYAREKLVNSGAGATLRARHMAHYAHQLIAFDDHIRGPRERESMEELVAELDNLRSAFEWSLATDPRLALRISGCWWFFACSGHGEHIEQWASSALDANPDEPSVDRSAAIRSLASVRFFRDDLEGAIELAERSKHMSLAIDDADGVRWAFFELMSFPLYASRALLSLPYALEALDLAQVRGDDDLRTDAMYALAMCDPSLQAGERRAILEEAAAALRLRGDAHVESNVRLWLGHIARGERDWSEAQEQYERSVELARTSGCLGCTTTSEMTLAWHARQSGDLNRAIELCLAVLPSLRRLHRAVTTNNALALATAAMVIQDRDQAETAARLLGVVDAVTRASRPLSPTQQQASDRRTQSLRAKLGDEDFDRAFAAGGTMPWDEAVSHAIEALESA